jgi:hypothetical protein
MNESDLPEIKMGTKYLHIITNLSDETLIFKEIIHDGCVTHAYRQAGSPTRGEGLICLFSEPSFMTERHP